jgi:hypothetical protein
MTPVPAPGGSNGHGLSDGAPVEPGQQLPGRCYREGLLTYVDRDRDICFAYPQGFAFAGAEGDYAAGSQHLAELRGPAIGSGPEPLFARLSLDFQPYRGVDLGPYVDAMIERDVPADFAAKVERTQATWGGHGAEVLEPWPGQLSSRVVIVDAAPAGYHLLYFWPSFKDTASGKIGADAARAQADMNALYEIVSETFATLSPASELSPGAPGPGARACRNFTVGLTRQLFVSTISSNTDMLLNWKCSNTYIRAALPDRTIDPTRESFISSPVCCQPSRPHLRSRRHIDAQDATRDVGRRVRYGPDICGWNCAPGR